jgi:BMFP domain-containing protein YqiC
MIDVEQLLKDLSYEHNSDLQKMFEAVLNAKLNPLDFVLGEAIELNKLKKLITKNKED